MAKKASNRIQGSTYKRDETGRIFITITYLGIGPERDDPPREWEFKEFLSGEFVSEKFEPINQDESQQVQLERIYRGIINAMMVKGEKLTIKTPLRIFNFLKSELTDFLD